MIEKIKQLREQTKAPLALCKKALIEANGDLTKAKQIIEREFSLIVDNQEEKGDSRAGIIDAYIHSNKKIGVLLELNCQTDFVAQNENFQKLAHEICLQIASMNPKNIEELLSQPWIRDNNKTISQLINETSALLGEKISLSRFQRYDL